MIFETVIRTRYIKSTLDSLYIWPGTELDCRWLHPWCVSSFDDGYFQVVFFAVNHGKSYLATMASPVVVSLGCRTDALRYTFILRASIQQPVSPPHPWWMGTERIRFTIVVAVHFRTASLLRFISLILLKFDSSARGQKNYVNWATGFSHRSW